MEYHVHLPLFPSVQSDLKCNILQHTIETNATIIMQKIDALASNPFALNNNVKKLVNRPEYRLRVGDWRVLYAVQEGNLVIEMIRIAPRGGVYS